MTHTLNKSDHASHAADRIIAPYITAWSEEQEPQYELVVRHGRIAYTDENVADRDKHGVLWNRTPSRPRHGRPEFGKVHSLRQRRTMRRLLCQVCAGPADRNEDGVLWLLQDHREDWDKWPEAMTVTEPPICLPCIQTSVRLCPALRRGPVVVRVGRFPLYGIEGALYRVGLQSPVATRPAIVPFNDPIIKWIRAAHLVRELHDCEIIPLEKLSGKSEETSSTQKDDNERRS
jgi:hypothetical protein